MRWLMSLIMAVSLPVSAEVAVVSSYRELTINEASEIFRFERFSFSDGARIKMFVLPRDHYTTREFSYALGTTPTRLHERAETAFSTGRLNLLKVVNSDKDVLRDVNKSEGSIGYVQGYWVIPSSAPAVIRYR